ncbi:MAG: response regulator transcription factor [Pseudomonadota bacterium]
MPTDETNKTAGASGAVSKPVVIADDHPLFRAALSQAVSAAAPGRAIIETSSLKEARSAIENDAPGLLCLDLHMGDSDGFAGLVSFRQDWPSVPIAIVSGDESQDVIRRALAFGAAAFIPKSLDMAEIREAVEAVLDGDEWAPRWYEEAGDDDASALADRLNSLTPTQLKVLLLVHQGLLNKQIAYELSISEATVKAHLTAIFKKLEVQTRTQAVVAARALVVDPVPATDDA